MAGMSGVPGSYNPMLKAILFDLDGVLIDSYDAWFSLFNRALEHFGYDRISEPVFRRHWGMSTEKDIEIFMPKQTIEEVRAFFIKYYNEYLTYLQVDKDARSVLTRLRHLDLHLGCVTNSHRVIVDTVLPSKQLNDFFEVVLTADDVTKPKPAPDLLLQACSLMQVQANETIFIGDTETDLQAGTRAGCIVVGYRLPCSYAVQELHEFYDLVVSMHIVQ